MFTTGLLRSPTSTSIPHGMPTSLAFTQRSIGSLAPNTSDGSNGSQTMMSDDETPPISSNGNGRSTRIAPSVRCSTSDLRIARDLAELQTAKFSANCDTRITFPDGVANLRRFHVLVTPTQGLYAHSSFQFSIFIPQQYPFSSPKVRCQTKCFHPNINWRTGQVHLSLLKFEWKPVLSINAVIFSLQLLFLEPWPTGALSVTTAASHPPTRPVLPSSAASSFSPHSALTLASSKCAAASAARQLDEENILNLEVMQLIRSGDRSTFEDLVRRTLEGGWFFGENWQRNKIEQYESDQEEEEKRKELENDHTHNMQTELALRRVDEYGRRAQISPIRPVVSVRGRSRSNSNHMHDALDSSGDHLMADSDVLESHSSSDCSPSILITPAGPSDSPSGSPSHSSPTTRSRRSILPTLRKRSFCQTSPSREYQHNPAAQIGTQKYSMTVEDEIEPCGRTKRYKGDNTNISQSRATTLTSARSITIRRSPQPPSVSLSLQASLFDIHRLQPPTVSPILSAAAARSLRKRPSPGSLSDGEYEEDTTAESNAFLSPHGNHHTHTFLHHSNSTSSHEAKDDGSDSLAQRRRFKKQKPSTWQQRDDGEEEFGLLHSQTLKNINDLDFDSEMSEIEANGGVTLFPTLSTQSSSGTSRTPSSFTLPFTDLSQFASFKPSHSPEEAARQSTRRIQKDREELSQSPKRNASDAVAVRDIGSPLQSESSAFTRCDSTSSSFILAGRSSSRSVNLFGSTKAQVVHANTAGSGLADLQGILASLPSAPVEI